MCPRPTACDKGNPIRKMAIVSLSSRLEGEAARLYCAAFFDCASARRQPGQSRSDLLARRDRAQFQIKAPALARHDGGDPAQPRSGDRRFDRAADARVDVLHNATKGRLHTAVKPVIAGPDRRMERGSGSLPI